MMHNTYKTTVIVFFLTGFFGIGALFAACGCPYQIAGDLYEDCSVNFKDLAVMAQHWLVDCNITPGNPACLPKWTAEAPMFVGRDQFTGGVINGKIYVFGGNGNPNQVDLKSTEMLDPATDWTNRADNNHNGGNGVEELTGAVVNGKLYVFGAWGGIGPGGHYGDFNFNEQYDPNTDSWTTLAPKPTVLTGGPATVYNGEVYLFGGGYNYDGKDEPNDYNVVEAYNPATNSWRFVTNMPKMVGRPGVATVGQKAYLIGGYLLDEKRFSGEIMTFDFQTELWDTNSCEPLAACRIHASVYSSAAPVVDGKIFLIGGIEGDSANHGASRKVDIYDTVTNKWQAGPSLPLPLDNHLSVVLDNKIYVIGGNNVSGYINRAKSEVISLSLYVE